MKIKVTTSFDISLESTEAAMLRAILQAIPCHEVLTYGDKTDEEIGAEIRRNIQEVLDYHSSSDTAIEALDGVVAELCCQLEDEAIV